jgi:gamma-glutamylcysteine synthetase
MTGKVVGAAKAGERNDTVASCETGFCKSEFSLAHVADLFELERATEDLRETLRRFSEDRRVYFLGYGIQPVTSPCGDLMMKKTRTSVWEGTFGPDRIIPAEEGGDVCLFTVNAASHVHVGVPREEAISAVNVLNGFAGAQIALTAHSNVWKGGIDPEYKCAAEKLWDWWIPEPGRVGMPEKRFADLADYVDTVASFRPVYVKRDGQPIVLKRYGSFAEYFASGRAVGEDIDGKERVVVPEAADIDLHCTCYWHNARLSRYYTVENRANDQQVAGEMF